MRTFANISAAILMILLVSACTTTSRESTLAANDDQRAESARVARENAYDRQAQQKSMRESRTQESKLRTKKSP